MATASHPALCSQKAAPTGSIVAELQAKLQKNKKDLVPSKPSKASPAGITTRNGGVAVQSPFTNAAAAAAVRGNHSPAASSQRPNVFSPPASPSASKLPDGHREGRPSSSNTKTELRKTTSTVVLGGNSQDSEEKQSLVTRRSVGGGGGKELTALCSQRSEQSGLTVVVEQPSPSAVAPALNFGYQNVFDDPPPLRKPAIVSNKDAALQKQKKPIPIPRKNSSTDVPSQLGNCQVDEGVPSEEISSPDETATPRTNASGSWAVSQLSKSLNDLDDCINSAKPVAESKVPRQNAAVGPCKSAEDVCSDSAAAYLDQTAPAKKQPPSFVKQTLTKTTSISPSHSQEGAPPEVRNRACSEGDLTAAVSCDDDDDDDYVRMASSPRHSGDGVEYLELLPTEVDTLDSPDGMYMDISLEVFGKVDTTLLADTPPTTSLESKSVVGSKDQLAEVRAKRSLPSSPSPPAPIQLSREQPNVLEPPVSPREEVGGAMHPPAVPKRPAVSVSDRSSSSSSSDDYTYAVILGKKGFKSLQSSDPPKESMPTKRDVAFIKPPDPPPKSKSLLREQGVLLVEDENKKKLGGKNGKPNVDAAVKETTKKDKGPKVEPYSGRGPKSSSPIKVTAKTSMVALAEVPEQNQRTAHPPVRPLVSISSSESDFETTNAWGLKKPVPPRPPPPKASRTKVCDQNVYSGGQNVYSGGQNVYSGGQNVCSGGPTDNSMELSQAQQKEPKDDMRREKVMNNLRTKIDRSSLLVIMENREAIYKQLGLGSCEQDNKEGSTVGILGKILMQIDSLLNTKLYSEKELIDTIEKHLNIRLSSPSEERANEGEGPTKSKDSKLILTDQDVDQVNQLVNSGCSEEDLETEIERPEVNSEEEIKSSEEQGSRRVSQEGSDSDCEYVSSVTLGMAYPPPPSPRNRKPHSLSLSTIDTSQLKVVGGGDRRPSTLADEVISNISYWDSGVGTFTEKGGVLTKSGSGVRVEVPQGAIARDRRQQMWFEMKDTLVLEDQADATCPLQRQGPPALCRGNEPENHFRSKTDTLVQLSPIVEVGPSDIMLFKAIQVTIPHCLSLRSLGWNIHVEGKVNSSGEWLRLPKSQSDVVARKSKAGLFWNSSYQLHMNHVTVHTTQLGMFRLVGSPMMKGVRSGKKMVASVYARGSQEAEEGTSCLPVNVFITNDLCDHSEALGTVLPARGYGNMWHRLPFYCTGDGRDIEMTLECDLPRTRRMPSTQYVPFGQFWRQKKIGQSQVTFYLDTGKATGPLNVTLKVQQVGAESKDIYQCTFVIE